MIFDGHSDILTDVTIRRLQGERQILQKYHLPRLAKGKVEGGCFVIWIDPPYDKDPQKRLNEILQGTKEELAECQDVVLIHNHAELMAAKKSGKFFILLGMEGLSGLGEDVDRIYELYDFGVRHAMLTWNEQNTFATGVLGDTARGLTTLGEKAIKILQEKKMIVDVSHLNERSFWDIMKVTEGPILASHSNAKALASAARNLTDAQLLEIRDTKGLVGLNSFNLHVSDREEEQTITQFVKHASYIADKIGVEHLGFGFDFFEFLSTDATKGYSTQSTSYTQGLEDCSKVPVLLETMKKAGFTEKDLEMISSGNWHHFIERVLG